MTVVGPPRRHRVGGAIDPSFVNTGDRMDDGCFAGAGAEQAPAGTPHRSPVDESDA